MGETFSGLLGDASVQAVDIHTSQMDAIGSPSSHISTGSARSPDREPELDDVTRQLLGNIPSKPEGGTSSIHEEVEDGWKFWATE